jgi:IclR family pca regulon transcriptional regulator
MWSNAMDIAKADFIEGMAKGLAVLESFDTERQRLNATLAAQRAGLTRAAARRHLLTLAHLGYLETDGSHFWLAPKVLRFSGSYLASARLPRVLQPYAQPAGRADAGIFLSRGAGRRGGGDRGAQRGGGRAG